MSDRIHGNSRPALAQDRKLIGWKSVGQALAGDPESWSEYIRCLKDAGKSEMDANLAEWYVGLLDNEASEKTAGNVGVTLIDVRAEGIEIEYT